MENKVGDNVPSQKKLDELLNQLRTTVEALKEFCITMQKEERPYTAKPHKNADKLTRKAYDLAKRHGVTVNNVPLEGMMNDLRLSEQIQPFNAVLTLGAQLAADTTLQANSEYYTAFLAYYGALCRAAEHDPALAVELKEIQDEMRKARGSRGGGEGLPGGAAGGKNG